MWTESSNQRLLDLVQSKSSGALKVTVSVIDDPNPVWFE